MILVDTGPLVAVAASNDSNHDRCVKFFATAPRPLLVTSSVIPEVAYLLERYLGSNAEASFLRSFSSELSLQEITLSDVSRCADLVDQYSDLPLGTVDASLVAVAERLGIRTLATLDRRHFSVVRPRHVAAFDLVPQ